MASTNPRKFAFISTSMGRLEHVKLSSAALMANPEMDGVNCRYFIVDYACPDKTGEWCEKEYGDLISICEIEKEVIVTRKGKPLFNKSSALNIGAYAAMQEGFDYLVFLDADTLVRPDFCQYVTKNASSDSFSIIIPLAHKRDLNGLLVVNIVDFLRVGGFDILFRGWGAEDLDIRLKLFLELGRKFTEMPPWLATSIAHNDKQRTSNYAESDKDVSHMKNLRRLCTNAYQCTGGLHLLDLYNNKQIPSDTLFHQFSSPEQRRFIDPDIGYCVRRLLGIDMTVHPSSIL